MDGYAGGDNFIRRIDACGRVGKYEGIIFARGCRRKKPARRYVDLQVSQVTCIWFGLNKMYADMYISVCSGHTGYGKLLYGMVYSGQNFILMNM